VEGSYQKERGKAALDASLSHKVGPLGPFLKERTLVGFVESWKVMMFIADGDGAGTT
jgi:hypothetical protein